MLESILNIKNYFLNPYAAPYFIVGILTIWEGVFIILQNKKAPINLSYAFACAGLAIWLIGVGAIYSSRLEGISLFWARYFCFLGIIFVTPAVHLFSICWQETQLTSQATRKNLGLLAILKKRKVIIFNLLCALTFYFFCIATKFLISGTWQFPWGYYPKAGIAYFLFPLWFYLLMAVSIKNFIDVYRKEGSAVKKKQVKIIIIAFSIGFLGSVEFLPNYGVALYLCAFIVELICITMVGYCVIRYRLMDIETAVHKTIVWFLTNLALVMPLIALIYFTRTWYLSFKPIGIFSFLGSLLLFFLFFVKTLQPKIDHFFQRRQSNLEEISNRFTEELVHLRGLNQLIKRIENTIFDSLYSQRIDVYIYHDSSKKFILGNALVCSDKANKEIDGENEFLQWLAKNDKIAYREFVDIDPKYSSIKEEARNYFNLTEAAVAVPLVLNEKLLGVINLGKKANFKRYNAVDFRFLTIFKNQSAIAISNSLLYENMEDQVKQRTKELVEIQKQLIQAEKLASVGTLAGGVAHEINNPLTAILTNVQMLLSYGGADNAKLDRESLELIEEATKRCRTIVKKLMAYAKKPLEVSEVRQVDLCGVLNNVSSFLSYQFEQENIKIISEAKEGNYIVIGNQNELEQVVTNMVLNAKDAIQQIKKAGEIYLSLSKDNQWIKIRIKDEGIGIPKESISKIFDPFFTTKDVGKGTGLGLSICQSIIEAHNGLITVESQLNKGSVFTIQLPKTKETIQTKI